VGQVREALAALAGEEDGLAAIVVGVPVRLDGTASEETVLATRFIEALKRHTTIPVVEEDERLTSREAEGRLALRSRDWRDRKKAIDAAAAAVILQDYLDRRGARG
jgi:putative Holliday junction resolvase